MLKYDKENSLHQLQNLIRDVSKTLEWPKPTGVVYCFLKQWQRQFNKDCIINNYQNKQFLC